MLSKAIPQAVMSVGLLWTYVLVVLFYGETILQVPIRSWYVLAAAMAGVGGLYVGFAGLFRRQLIVTRRLNHITIASVASLLSLLALDIGYSIVLNTVYSTREEIEAQRLVDQYVWSGEHMPRRYQPDARGFFIHKPNVYIESDTYGGFYYRGLLESPTLAGSVLELRRLAYDIDEHGFRETTPLHKARVFALGDSFTFGMSVSQDQTWVKVLEAMVGEPIYNLGVSGHSPKEELMLLEYLLKTKPTIKINHLLWMIFEGNDLEGDYRINYPIEKQKQATGESGFRNMFQGTILSTLYSIPITIKAQSVIHRLRTGQVSLTKPFQSSTDTEAYLVDNVRLVRPLYYSELYGCSLFDATHIERAGKTKTYVFGHANRIWLDQTFRDMASLGRKFGFKTTVLIAPTAPRLYAPYFDSFPRISEEAYFINYVEQLAVAMGFDVINLYEQMRPYAKTTLLYWRDDPHWNADGNKVVADIIAKQLFMETDSRTSDWRSYERETAR